MVQSENRPNYSKFEPNHSKRPINQTIVKSHPNQSLSIYLELNGTKIIDLVYRFIILNRTKLLDDNFL